VQVHFISRQWEPQTEFLSLGKQSQVPHKRHKEASYCPRWITPPFSHFPAFPLPQSLYRHANAMALKDFPTAAFLLPFVSIAIAIAGFY